MVKFNNSNKTIVTFLVYFNGKQTHNYFFYLLEILRISIDCNKIGFDMNFDCKLYRLNFKYNKNSKPVNYCYKLRFLKNKACKAHTQFYL